MHLFLYPVMVRGDGGQHRINDAKNRLPPTLYLDYQNSGVWNINKKSQTDESFAIQYEISSRPR